MNQNRLKLNDQKTEFIIFGTSSGLKKVSTKSIRVGEESIPVSNTVRNIGAMFDQEMKMDAQVNSMCESAWYHLYMIQKIRQHYLTFDQTKSIVHAYVTSKLDGNNALLGGHIESRKGLKRKLRLIKHTRKYDHVTQHLHELHWLPISKRIIFKVLLLV